MLPWPIRQQDGEYMLPCLLSSLSSPTPFPPPNHHHLCFSIGRSLKTSLFARSFLCLPVSQLGALRYSPSGPLSILIPHLLCFCLFSPLSCFCLFSLPIPCFQSSISPLQISLSAYFLSLLPIPTKLFFFSCADRCYESDFKKEPSNLSKGLER